MPHSTPVNFIDLTGKTFNQLTVIRRHEHNKNKWQVQWECLCSCGRSIVARGSKIKSGETKSCGCHRLKVCQLLGTSNRTHGATGTVEFTTWGAMRQRCNNPRHSEYRSYGGRGIKVCDRWNNSFQAFLDDMGSRPHGKYSIERIDNDGSYEPENCRWATRKEQASNRRSNRLISFNDLSLLLPEWAKRYGMHKNTLRSRLDKGWEMGRALTQPVGHNPHITSRI